jgi:hypothetical protein
MGTRVGLVIGMRRWMQIDDFDDGSVMVEGDVRVIGHGDYDGDRGEGLQ